MKEVATVLTSLGFEIDDFDDDKTWWKKGLVLVVICGDHFEVEVMSDEDDDAPTRAGEGQSVGDLERLLAAM